MLKLAWTIAPDADLGRPGSDGYNAAFDNLSVLTDGGLQQPPAQTFAKGVQGAADASPALAAAIDQWIARVPGSRIIVMAHGYQFDPSGNFGGMDDNPFNLVYGVPGTAFNNGTETVNYHNSWLPLVGEADNLGNAGAETAVAFSWVTMGGLSDYPREGWRTSYQYAALELTPLAAKALATVLRYLNSKNKIIYILAHSLGTRLVSQAIGLLRRGVEDTQIERVVLLGGAEFCPDAKANLLNRNFEVINIGSRRDVVLRVGAEGACDPFRGMGTGTEVVIGRDGLVSASNWLDIQIDLPATMTWLKQQRYSVFAEPADDDVHPFAILGHWVYYMHNGDPDHADIDGGNRKLVKDILADPEMDIAWFRQSGLNAVYDVGSYGQIIAEVPITPASYADRVVLDNPQLAQTLGLSNNGA